MSREMDTYAKPRHPEEKIFWIVGLGLFTISAVPGVFVFVFHNLDWGGPAEWATFATYFSGITTPIVALCSALLFYRSLIVQRDEFDKTRREMQQATELQHKAVLAQERSNQLMKLSEELKQEAHIQAQMEKAIDRYSAEKERLNKSFYVFFPRTRVEKLSFIQCVQKFGADRLISELPNGVSKEKLVSYLYNYMKLSIDLIQVLTKYLRNGGDIHTYRHINMEIAMEHNSVVQLIKHLGYEDETYGKDYDKAVSFFVKFENQIYRSWFEDH